MNIVAKHVKFAVKYAPRTDFLLKNDYLYAFGSKMR